MAMLEGHLHPALWQDRTSERAATGLAVMLIHFLLLAVLVFGLAQQVMQDDPVMETPVMVNLLPRRTKVLPPPVAATVTVRNPVRARRITPAPETAPSSPAPSPVQVAPTPLQAQPNESQSIMLASAAPPAAGTGPGANGTAAGAAGADGVPGGGGIDISEYLARVSRHIQFYLSNARIYSNARIRIYMSWKKDGTITELRLARSSNDANVDAITLRVVRAAMPLPPIPSEFRMESIEGELPIVLETVRKPTPIP